MSEANLTKLTLERWAAMDAAASPGPYSSDLIDEDYDNPEDMNKASAFVSAPEMIAASDGDFLNKPTCDFLASCKGAPTRLLDALRGLRADWAAYRQQLDAMGNHGQAIVLDGCQQELGHLIETLDLAAPEQALGRIPRTGDEA